MVDLYSRWIEWPRSFRWNEPPHDFRYGVVDELLTVGEKDQMEVCEEGLGGIKGEDGSYILSITLGFQL